MSHSLRPRTRRNAACALVAAIVCSGATSAQVLTPQQEVELRNARHVLSRLEYGVDFDQAVGLMSNGTTTQPTLINNYILAQLALPTGDNAQITNLLTLYPGVPARGASATVTQPGIPGNTIALNDVVEVDLAMALLSDNALREKLARFWRRHFNTHWGVTRSYFINVLGLSPALATEYATFFEWQQYDEFWLNATGTFRDLLHISAKSVPMLIYLDSVNNVAAGPNENYARELMELHTLGLDSPYPISASPLAFIDLTNYAYVDIQAAARMFTGWTVQNFGTPTAPNIGFFFDGTLHSTTPATNQLFVSSFTTPGAPYITPLIPQTAAIPVDTLNPTEGDALLDHLAASPATAWHICNKLYELFMSEEPPAPDDPVILAMFGAWGTQGDITGVLGQLFLSRRFRDNASFRWELARTPLENLGQPVAVFRGQIYDPAATAQQNRNKLIHLRRDMLEERFGQYLYRYPAPDGFSIAARDLLTTQRILGGLNLRQEVYSLWNLGTYPFVTGSVGFDWFGLANAWLVNVLDETAIRDWFGLFLFAGEHSSVDDAYMLDFLLRDVTGAPATTNLATDFATNLAVYQQRVTQAIAEFTSFSLNNVK